MDTTGTTATTSATQRPDPADQLRLPPGRRPVPTGGRPAGRRVPVVGYALTGLLLLGGMVGGSMALGWWQTDCGGANDAIVASQNLTPDDIKGSMTVEQVVTGFPMLSTADVLSAFEAPADTPPSTQLKTLVQNGSPTDVSDFRIWLAERLATSPTP